MANGTARDWAPRVWEGMDFFAWLRLLHEGRYRVEPPYWYIAGIITWVSFLNTSLRWVQHARHRKELAKVELDPPPLFILGHWRTGTTLLHELLSLDDRHTGPTTHHCLEPCHLILSEDFFREKLGFLLPGTRPMDNMAFGWDQPQEDEFALALLGEPSTYCELAFPNRHLGANAANGATPLDLSSLSPRQVGRWQRTLKQFLQMVAFADRRRTKTHRRLILKSPPHTARVPALLELFPQARFAFIKRDPVEVYLSTVNLWQSLTKKHGLQTLRRPELIEQKVLTEFRTLADRYEQAKALIPAGHLMEIRYEELAGDLVGGLKGVYDGLSLGEWERVRPRVEEYAALRQGYVRNTYNVDASVRDTVQAHWGDIITRWGY